MVKCRVSPSHKIQKALAGLNLHPGRKIALFLLQEAAELGDLQDYPPPHTIAPTSLSDYCSNLECLNCRKMVDGGKVYCDEACRGQAIVVRLVRRRLTEGRIWEAETQLYIGMHLLMIYGGGYPTSKRKITKASRMIIFERDGGLCTLCGGSASQIDHIDGDSSDLENLRAVCGPCNRDRAFSESRMATVAEAAKIRTLNSDLARRIAAPVPLKVCDHPAWSRKLSATVRGNRRRRWNELMDEADGEFEDVDGYLAHAMAKND